MRFLICEIKFKKLDQSNSEFSEIDKKIKVNQ